MFQNRIRQHLDTHQMEMRSKNVRLFLGVKDAELALFRKAHDDKGELDAKRYPCAPMRAPC